MTAVGLLRPQPQVRALSSASDRTRATNITSSLAREARGATVPGWTKRATAGITRRPVGDATEPSGSRILNEPASDRRSRRVTRSRPVARFAVAPGRRRARLRAPAARDPRQREPAGDVARPDPPAAHGRNAGAGGDARLRRREAAVVGSRVLDEGVHGLPATARDRGGGAHRPSRGGPPAAGAGRAPRCAPPPDRGAGRARV